MPRLNVRSQKDSDLKDWTYTQPWPKMTTTCWSDPSISIMRMRRIGRNNSIIHYSVVSRLHIKVTSDDEELKLVFNGCSISSSSVVMLKSSTPQWCLSSGNKFLAISISSSKADMSTYIEDSWDYDSCNSQLVAPRHMAVVQKEQVELCQLHHLRNDI